MVVGVLLIFSLVSAACSTEAPQHKQKTQPRIDSYDDILRPPPPPPNLRFTHPNQRYQRQNHQFRQPHVLRQPFYMPPQERYPPAPWKEPEQPSMLQKVSSWLFATGSDSVPSTSNHPTHPNQEPAPSFGPPIRLQQNQQKKNCNLCNHFPWIPVIRYQTPPIKNTGEPSKLLLPPQDHIYIPPKSNGDHNHLSDGPTYNLKPPITNSYGKPIPPNTYDTPLPVTNDGGELPVLPPHRKPYSPEFDVEEIGNQDGRYSNKDTIENLESNNVPLLSKPQHKDVRGQASSFKSTNYSGHSSRPAINNIYDNGRGVHVLQPIPFPNLSSVPIPPIFNARPWKTNNNNHASSTKLHYDSVSSSTQYPIDHSTYYSQSSLSNSQSTQNYQLSPSVSLAEFTSSIDYPISIIQSPLVEIDASKGDSYENNKPSDSAVQSNNINLNKNPIIVQNDSYAFDSYSAASGGNDLGTNQESINFVTRDTIKSERPFLPTPIPVETNSKIHSLTPISYSFIDQTFSSGDKPSSIPTSTPSHHYTEHNSNLLDHTNTYKPYPTDTLQSLDSPFLYLKPSVPHKESELFKQSTTSKPVTQNTHVSSSIANTGFRYLENSVVEGKWPPPAETVIEKINDTTPKPKRIQIIIPYTTKNQPSPFRYSNNNVVSPSGWVPVIRDIEKNYGRKVQTSSTSDQNSVQDLHTTSALIDYHESSESKIIASSAPQHNDTTFSYETSSVKPKKPKPTDLLEPIKNKISFDEKKLQQNIDEWTSLEYSKVYKRQQKASTTSHLKRSKKIPDEYLTTTPVQKKPTQVFLSKINDLNGSLLDSESANSIRYTYETNLYNRTSVPKANYTHQKSTSKEPFTIYYTTEELRKTSVKMETTTVVPKTTTKPAWETVQTSISPLTKEKIYVVTPQPWHIVNSTFSFVNNASESKSKENLIRESKNLSFKSPRFVVRPTPGPTGSQKELYSDDKFNNGNNWKASFSWLQSINNLEETTPESRSSKGFFGLSTVTAYTPPDGSSVHTYSGHSRVTAVTPSTLSKLGK
ncbi:uncharacterized protein LOC143911667 isoform X2 [Arctopsyche grandis]|uniref:uncharacterized protein LOC143911667 isoform X2 n=1 Tax=Arctopsyche grandis TaxID=121162 RepID=UPI00406D7A27